MSALHDVNRKLDLFIVADRLREHLSDQADPDTWATRVEIHLLAFRSLLDCHIQSIDDDLYHEAVRQSPRIRTKLARLTAECAKLDELATMALAKLHSPTGGIGGVVDAVGALVRMVSMHEHHSVELDHEAFAVDIGGPG